MKTQQIIMALILLFSYHFFLDEHKSYAGSTDRLPSVVNLADKPNGVILIKRPAEAASFSAACVADLNKDGYDDAIFIGILKDTDSAMGRIYVIYILYGCPNFPASEVDFDDPQLNTASIRIQTAGKNLIPYDLKTGDVNGDGLKEFIFLASTPDVSWFYSYWICIIPGRSKWNRDTILREDNSDYIKLTTDFGFGWGMGYSNFIVTDMNKDGIDDIALMSNKPVFDPYWYNIDIIPRTVSTIYIVYGAKNLPSNIRADQTTLAVAQIQDQPDSVRELYGMGIGASGDFNGDNKPDLLLNADRIDNIIKEGSHSAIDTSFFYGKTYIIPGSLLGRPEYTQTPLYLAQAASAIGILETNYIYQRNTYAFVHDVLFSCDINGDGYNDAIIAHSNIPDGNKKNSKIYIKYGSSAANLSGNLDLMRTGITRIYSADSSFGSNLASGDVNGDGYTDLLAGMYGRSFYVIYGGMLPDSINLKNDQIFTSLVNGASSGVAGDINGDGYDDVVCNGSAGIYIILGRGQTYTVGDQIIKVLPVSTKSRFNFKFGDGTGFNFNFAGKSLSTSPILRLTNFGRQLPANLNSIPSGEKAVAFIEAKLANMADSCLMKCSIAYDKQTVRSLGIKEENLSVSYWDEKLLKWQREPSTVDSSLNHITFETNHFSLWALVDVNDPVLSVNDQNSNLPFEFKLEQNYPNPFNPITTIKYQLPKASRVSLKIYNILGQEIKTVTSEQLSAGIYEARWDGTNNFGSKVSSGIYIYRLETNKGYINTRKMVYLK